MNPRPASVTKKELNRWGWATSGSSMDPKHPDPATSWEEAAFMCEPSQLIQRMR
jgi:hypothetical protein